MRPKIIVPLMALGLLCAADARAAPPGAIAVVCDQEIGPYRALVESFTKASALPVRALPCGEASQPGLEERLKRDGVRAVLAVGMQSRAAVEGLRELPVLLAMVPRVEPWVAAWPNRLGIEMAPSPRESLEMLRRALPRARRVGVVYDPGQVGAYVREAAAAAAALGIELAARELARPAELANRLAGLRGQADVIWLLPDATVLQGENLEALLLFSFESRLPVFGFARKYAELGAIAATNLDPGALGVQAAGLLTAALDRPPAPVSERWRYADGVRLIVNRKVAGKLGISFDPGVLEGADDVAR